MKTFSREKVDFRNYRPCGNFEKTDVGYMAKYDPHPSRLRRATFSQEKVYPCEPSS